MSGRIRTIKPEILDDEKTAMLSDREWRTFVSLIALADDYGNLRGNDELIFAKTQWGSRETREDSRESRESLARALDGLQKVDLILRYEVGGQKYISIIGWSSHQRVDKPGKPKVPGPPQVKSAACDKSSRKFARAREDVANVRGSLAPEGEWEREEEGEVERDLRARESSSVLDKKISLPVSTRIDPNFKPKQSTIEALLIAGRRPTADDVLKFVAHYEADGSKNALRPDWDAAFRKWVLNSFNDPRSARPKVAKVQQGTDAKVEEEIQKAIEQA